MKTVAITGKKNCQLIEKEMPNIEGNFALIEVKVAPMCNEHVAFEHEIYLERNRPDSLGHEMAGVVVKTGEDSSVRVGQRVVALCGFPCGECRSCKKGYYAHCADNFQDPREFCNSESGECSFAEYAIKPDWLLVPIPDSLSYEHAAMACCGLGPSFGAFKRMNVRQGATVLITGLGPVGLGGVINAKKRGATVIGVARSEYRAELARKLGCDVVLSPNEIDLKEKILELTQGEGVDCALECSGQETYQRLLIDSVARLGSVCFLSEPGEITLNIDNDLIQKGVSIYGSLDINLNDVKELLDVIGEVKDKLDVFITHKFPLSEINQAFELQLSRECGKVLLYP